MSEAIKSVYIDVFKYDGLDESKLFEQRLEGAASVPVIGDKIHSSTEVPTAWYEVKVREIAYYPNGLGRDRPEPHSAVRVFVIPTAPTAE